MARNTAPDIAQLVRVPLADVPSVPHFMRWDALDAWLQAHNVDVQPDYADRPSIDLPTAYRLQREAIAEREAEQARRAAEAQKHAAAVEKAQHRRQDVFTRAYLAALPPRSADNLLGSAAYHQARQDAWTAVAAAEKNLPPDVVRDLGPVALDGLPGAANFGMSSVTLIRAEG